MGHCLDSNSQKFEPDFSDLQQFRQALAELQRQVDELDAIKAGYHEEVLDGEDEVSRL